MALHRCIVVMVVSMVVWSLPLHIPEASARQFETRAETLIGFQPGGSAQAASAGLSSRTSVATRAPMAFSMVAFEAPRGSSLWFRTADGADWGQWEPAPFLPDDEGPDDVGRDYGGHDDGGHDDGGHDHGGHDDGASTGRVFTDALWVREADRLQIRVEGGRLADVDAHMIDSTGVSLGFVARTVGSLGAPAANAAASPGIVTRAAWGADESLRRQDPSYALPRLAVVHHTAGSNDYTRAESAAIVRGIYSYHVTTRGWSDIGYNLLIDKYGQVFEGRFGGVTLGVVGAHAAGNNTGSFGVAMMGNFETATPSSSMIDALTNTLAWKFELHGIDPRPDAIVTHNEQQLSAVSGHRDVGATACPGRYLAEMLPEVSRRLADTVAQGWTPLLGDWDGDGVDTPGWFKNGAWRVVNEYEVGASTYDFSFGMAGDLPIVGDWNGDGRDTAGFVRKTTWHIRNENSSGVADRTFEYGRPGDVPLPGNWDGVPGDEAGIIRDRMWHLNSRLAGGDATWSFVYGRVTAGDLPLTGDWYGEGQDRVGIVRDGEWHLRDEYASGPADDSFIFGRVTRGDRPVVGRWRADSELARDLPGVVRGSGWYLRGELAAGPADLFVPVPTPDSD
jgi:hypothetical protein